MQEQEIHLRDYIRVIRKRKATVITFFLITFAIVVIGTLTATPQYSASTKILVEKNDANPLGRMYYYASQDMEFVETQSQIIKSKRVARKVVRILDLENNFQSYFPQDNTRPGFLQIATARVRDFFRETAGSFAAAKPVPAPHGDDSGSQEYGSENDGLTSMISGGISVSPVKESKVFDIGFMSENPVLAQRVANSVAKAYMEELLEMKMNSSGHTIKWMTQKAEEEKAKLEKSERALQEYMRAKDIVTIEDRITIIPQKLAEFSSQLSRAEARRKELEAVYRKIRQAAGDSTVSLEAIPAIVDNKNIQVLRNQIQQAQQKVSELSKKYGPKHPLMIKAKSELDGLLAKKKEEIKRASESIRNEYELAQTNEDNLRNLLAASKAEALGLNEKFIQYEVLKRDSETNRAMYEALLSRLKEQDITEKSQVVNVWIVEQAETPRSPAKPNKKRNILLGLVLGLFGGIGLAFFIEYLDNTVKTPEEAEERLGLPMLGTIERFAAPAKKEAQQELIALHEKQSSIVEGFKALRTAVLLSSADKPAKSIVVTSMMPGEGKTVTAANLAITIAQAGQKVLLIDGDMRKPRLHKLFKLDSRQGLSTYLAGLASADICQPGPLAGLSIIPAGPLPPNPSELLSSNRLAQLLEDQQSRFDIIIFDSAPIISITDTQLIGKQVDGVLLVARAAATTYDVISKGVKSLTDLDTNVLGLVINGFDAKKYRYYYGKEYYQYYGKYYGSDEA